MDVEFWDGMDHLVWFCSILVLVCVDVVSLSAPESRIGFCRERHVSELAGVSCVDW